MILLTPQDHLFDQIIKKYKGTPSALFWNALANFNGYSLKDGYDPEKEKYLEMILSAMEQPVPEAQSATSSH